MLSVSCLEFSFFGGEFLLYDYIANRIVKPHLSHCIIVVNAYELLDSNF